MEKDLQKMYYSHLEHELRKRIPEFVPKTLEECQRQVAELPLDDLLVYTEYCRRNMRFGHSELEAVTYEDAIKLILLPELLRRIGGLR